MPAYCKLDSKPRYRAWAEEWSRRGSVSAAFDDGYRDAERRLPRGCNCYVSGTTAHREYDRGWCAFHSNGEVA